MSEKVYVGCDPAHGGWSCAIAKEPNSPCTHPDQVHFISGKEKPNVIGSPELCKELYLEMSDKYMKGYYGGYVICVEEPRIHSLKLLRTMASICRDVGSIAQAFREFPVWTVLPFEWKGYLHESGLVPAMEKKGNKGAKIYQPILNEHFGTDLTDNELAAFSICYYNASNYEG